MLPVVAVEYASLINTGQGRHRMGTGSPRAAATLLAAAGIGFATPGLAQTTIEEVTVTAQKREQSLQDVSAAVTAIGEDRLDAAHIENLEDLQLIVPTVTFGNDFNM